MAARWQGKRATVQVYGLAERREATRGVKTHTEAIMKDKAKNGAVGTPAMPAVTDRASFQADLDALRVREKAHTREGDAIAAARRRLPMVELDPVIPLAGPDGPLTLLEAFEGRRQLIAYYFMWHTGRPAAQQCEGCTWVTTQVSEVSYLHSRDITYAVFCQGPYAESARYRDFMGWDMPWYSAQDSLGALLVGLQIGRTQLATFLPYAARFCDMLGARTSGAQVMGWRHAGS